MKKSAAFLFIAVFICSLSNAQEVSRWRGTNSTGVYTVEKLLPEWPAEGPKIIWSNEGLGLGYSSPVIANNKIYVRGMVEGQAVLFVLDLNGKELQRFPYGVEFVQSYPGCRST